MQPVIFYRDVTIREQKGELEAAQKYFHCVSSRMQVHNGDLVIARYSCLPFYAELAKDLDFKGAFLINSYAQHRYIADLRNWYEDLQEFTPKTWFRLEDIPKNGGPFFLKGETNSRKSEWDTHAYAKDFTAAGEVYSRLATDGLIGSQNIYIRQYMPFRKLMTGICGHLPITEEYRFFCCYGKLLCGAFYWSNYVDDLKEQGGFTGDVNPQCESLCLKVLRRIGGKANFVVIDVAILENGEPMLVELNDGQMSGLSENEPETLYKSLKMILDQRLQETA